jgi:GWxTD domain-containing protein
MRAHERRSTTAALAAVLLATLVSPAGDSSRAAPRPARKTDYDAPTVRWREGPVRYLLNKSEDDAYRALTTEEERARFILQFWSNRDPNRSTPDNEYRVLFYQRVAAADRIFTDSTKPGWKTDRGKIYILLGPPDDLDKRLGLEVILWSYRSRPGGTGTGNNSTIRFVRDATGEYRLSSDVRLSFHETPMSIGFQMQAMQVKSLPEPRQVLDTIVNTRSFLDTAPFRTHSDFFRALDGNTFAVLTLGLRESLLTKGDPGGTPLEPGSTAQAGGAGGATGPPGGTATGAAAQGAPSGTADRFEVMARLVGGESGLPTYDLAGPTGLRPGDVDPASSDGFLLFQGSVTVRPGSYTVYFGIVDRTLDQIYSVKEPLVVPDFHENRFMLSSITLASHLERVGSAHGYSSPFILGNFKVLPRPDDVFHNGDDLAFYYQIYGPATDPIDGRPDLDLEYRFFIAGEIGASGEPDFAPLGEPIRFTRQRTQVQGYSFPLKDWPRGAFRLRVEVTDNLSGNHSSREVAFQVR